jgi:STE24 endopeptidase
MDTSEWPMFKEPSWVAPTDGVSYLVIVIVFTFAVFAFEAYLDVRQHSAFTRNRGKQPPAGVEKETFEKSLAYGADKISFGMIEGTFSLLTGIAGTIGGYWPYLWTQSKIWTDMCVDRASTSPYKLECIQSIIFVVAFTLVETVITLPLSYWQTFKVEHSHGFNKTTVGLFFKDKLMVVLLTLFIGSPVIFAIIGLHLYFGPTFPWMIWSFLLVFSTFMMIIHPVLIAPLFNNYTEIKDGKLRDAVNALAARIEFPLTGLYVFCHCLVLLPFF